MIVKKLFYIFIFFPSFHIFSFIEDVEELEASKEDSQEKFYENNKKEFNIKGHLSISSGGINTITLSPFYGILLLATSYRDYNDFIYDVFSNVCCFQNIFFSTVSYGTTKTVDKKDLKYVFKGIPYSFFCWLFSGSLRYEKKKSFTEERL